MEKPSNKTNQIKSNIDELNGSYILALLITFVIGMMPLMNAEFRWTGLVTVPLILIVVTSYWMAFRSGRAVSWFTLVISVVAFFCGAGLLVLALEINLTDRYLTAILIFSLLISAYSSWRWGASIYNQETMKEVLASKRIDVENGTYSPFSFPFGILKKKSSKRWFLIANTSGPLIISASIILGSILRKYDSWTGSLWAAICGYALAIISIGAVRAGLGEYAWIRRWEKETGRKMYISYVVDWKRYKEEEKKHRQAEQSKLRSSRN